MGLQLAFCNAARMNFVQRAMNDVMFSLAMYFEGALGDALLMRCYSPVLQRDCLTALQKVN